MSKVIWSIAYSTLRGFSRDRIFHATLFVSVTLVVFCYFLSNLAVVESEKILLDFGFTAVSIAGIIIAIFLGISALSSEIEAKIVYTIFSKPISRMHYILGKYLGCAFTLVLVHSIMSITLMFIISTIGTGAPDGIFACFYFMLLESLLVLAIAIFSSVFSSTILATAFTVGMFLIGRSEYFLRTISEKSKNPIEKILLRVLHDILPNLDRFNIREVVAYSKPYPQDMLFTSTAYYLAYSIVFILFSIIFINRRDMP